MNKKSKGLIIPCHEHHPQGDGTPRDEDNQKILPFLKSGHNPCDDCLTNLNGLHGIEHYPQRYQASQGKSDGLGDGSSLTSTRPAGWPTITNRPANNLRVKREIWCTMGSA